MQSHGDSYRFKTIKNTEELQRGKPVMNLHLLHMYCHSYRFVLDNLNVQILGPCYLLKVLQERKAEHRIRKEEQLAQKMNKKSSSEVDDSDELISKHVCLKYWLMLLLFASLIK